MKKSELKEIIREVINEATSSEKAALDATIKHVNNAIKSISPVVNGKDKSRTWIATAKDDLEKIYNGLVNWRKSQS